MLCAATFPALNVRARHDYRDGVMGVELCYAAGGVAAELRKELTGMHLAEQMNAVPLFRQHREERIVRMENRKRRNIMRRMELVKWFGITTLLVASGLNLGKRVSPCIASFLLKVRVGPPNSSLRGLLVLEG